MLILALDSTAVVASVALCNDGTPIAQFTVKNGNTHSETLLPMVESVLKTAGITVDDVDLFACSVGPGSFTGVRIGVSTIKAENLIPAKGILCPVMNARRGQVYNALFRYENGTLVRLCADRALAVIELEEELLAMGEPVFFSGDGVDEIKRLATRIVPEGICDLLVDQNAVSVAKCAHKAYLRGEICTDAELKPIYLRLPQAERERLEKMKNT